MNVVTLDGRIANEPELKYVGAKETPLLVFNIANETGYGDYKQTGFWKCEIWGSPGEKMANHLFKGKPFTISGELQMDSWETPEGQKRTKPKIKVQQFSFHMPDPKEGQGESRKAKPPSGPPTGPPGGASNPFGNQPGDKAADNQSFDDDIPF